MYRDERFSTATPGEEDTGLQKPMREPAGDLLNAKTLGRLGKSNAVEYMAAFERGVRNHMIAPTPDGGTVVVVQDHGAADASPADTPLEMGDA